MLVQQILFAKFSDSFRFLRYLSINNNGLSRSKAKLLHKKGFNHKVNNNYSSKLKKLLTYLAVMGIAASLFFK